MAKFDLKPTSDDKRRLIKDIIHFTTYFLVIHILLYTVDNEGDLFDEKTLKILLYAMIGMAISNLVIRKIFLKKKKQKTEL